MDLNALQGLLNGVLMDIQFGNIELASIKLRNIIETIETVMYLETIEKAMYKKIKGE